MVAQRCASEARMWRSSYKMGATCGHVALDLVRGTKHENIMLFLLSSFKTEYGGVMYAQIPCCMHKTPSKSDTRLEKSAILVL